VILALVLSLIYCNSTFNALMVDQEMKNDIKEGAEALRASIIERKADADRFAQALNQV
jgi:hypothetical protein